MPGWLAGGYYGTEKGHGLLSVPVLLRMLMVFTLMSFTLVVFLKPHDLLHKARDRPLTPKAFGP